VSQNFLRGAVLGHPINHSLSPLLHKKAFDLLGITGEYSAIEVRSGELQSFIDLRGQDFDYFSLTMPLKEEALDLKMDIKIDALGKRIQSLNTLIRTENTWRATSTDGSGFISTDPALESNLPTAVKDLAQALEKYRPNANVFTNFYIGFLGKSLQQYVSTTFNGEDLCPLVTGNPAKEKLFSTLTVVGQTQFQQRPTLIVSGQSKFVCSAEDLYPQLQISGWYAIDIASGLATSRFQEVKLGYVPLFTSKHDCTFVGSPSATPTAGVSDRTFEDRLRELKGLYEKGLITKDQFEKRSSQILENL